MKVRRVEEDGSVGPVLGTAHCTLKREEVAPGQGPRRLDLDTVDAAGCVVGLLRVGVSVVSLLPVSLEEGLFGHRGRRWVTDERAPLWARGWGVGQ
jgi:hypothetical protein